MLHIVLLEPEIPYNTGNIGRTAVLTGARLHLIKPYGFSIQEKWVRKAGMDYWKEVDLCEHLSWEDFLRDEKPERFFLATTKAPRSYAEVTYRDGDYFVFGKESAGIDEEILKRYPDATIRIPMKDIGRSLNLSNSAAILLYEALRQTGYPDLR